MGDYPDTRDALLAMGLKRQQLDNGQQIKHKYRRGVTGEIKIAGGNYVVKWSDRGENWEVLHSGDVG